MNIRRFDQCVSEFVELEYCDREFVFYTLPSVDFAGVVDMFLYEDPYNEVSLKVEVCMDYDPAKMTFEEYFRSIDEDTICEWILEYIRLQRVEEAFEVNSYLDGLSDEDVEELGEYTENTLDRFFVRFGEDEDDYATMNLGDFADFFYDEDEVFGDKWNQLGDSEEDSERGVELTYEAIEFTSYFFEFVYPHQDFTCLTFDGEAPIILKVGLSAITEEYDPTGKDDLTEMKKLFDESGFASEI